MPDYNFKNNLKSTLQSKLWSDATSIYCNHVVESEDADTRRNAWPAFPFTLTIVDTANAHIEIIKCTSLANNSSDAIVFHCDRAQESTTAQTFEIATRVEHRLTSEALNSITNAVSPATTTARGIGRVATSADLVDGATINNGPAFLAAGSDALNAALAGKINADFSNKPTNVQYVVDTWKSGTEWYRVWSDGWIEQGGYMESSSSIINFKRAFVDVSYFISVTISRSSDARSGWTVLGDGGKLTSSCKIGFLNYENGFYPRIDNPFYWYACGY